MKHGLPLLFALIALGCDTPPTQRERPRAEKVDQREFATLVHLKGPLRFTAKVHMVGRLADTNKGDTPKKNLTAPLTSLDITEEITLHMDSHGTAHGRRTLSSGHGIEFHIRGERICVRLRYQKFLCRSYTPEEASRRVNDLWGSFNQALKPIATLSSWIKKGTCTAKTGPCTRYLLKGLSRTTTTLNLKKAHLQKISGWSERDPNGVPLSAAFSYTLKGQKSSGRVVELQVTYKHTLTRDPSDVKRPDPHMILTSWERQRHLKDREALLGSRIPSPLRYLYKE